MAISLDAQLQVREKCGDCTGTGVNPAGKEAPYCTLCYRDFPDAELERAMARGNHLPCGHHKSMLSYDDTTMCKSCNGAGHVERWAPLREVYAALCLLGDEALDEAEATPDEDDENDDPGEPIGPYDLYAAQRWEAGYTRTEDTRESEAR